MNLRRIGVLLGKELVWGPKGFILILAVVAPIVLTLAVQLLVGSLFSGKPRLGVVDLGRSALTTRLEQDTGIVVRQYTTAAALQTAVGNGALDMGVVLAADFDARLSGATPASLTVYVSGESLLSDRALLGSALVAHLRALTGATSPVTVVAETVAAGSASWETRLLPFIVLMAVILGGVMVPATALVQEKQQRTITAVLGAGVSLDELFAAKGLLGYILSLGMGVVILLLNRAFGGQPALLVGLLALGAVLAAGLGVLLGAFVKDINTLFAAVKGLGILLYAPALVYLFPSLPQWIGRLFPTYYIVNPIMQVVQNGAGWSAVRSDALILTALNLVIIGVCGLVARRARANPALLPGVAG